MRIYTQFTLPESLNVEMGTVTSVLVVLCFLFGVLKGKIVTKLIKGVILPLHV